MLSRVLLPCLLVLLAAPAALADGPVATAAKTCSIKGKERRLGTTYVFSGTLKASGTSCGAAENVVKAFHACRHKHGKAGECSKRVKGYRCRETRFDKIPTQYSARVSCTKSGARVKHAYQQNT